MSVHGEYQRTLRVVQVRLSEAGDAVGACWLEAFSRAQVDATRDLSTTARTVLELVVRLEAELAPGGDPDRPVNDRTAATTERLAPLRDACHHLRAHCRAILGLGSED